MILPSQKSGEFQPKRLLNLAGAPAAPSAGEAPAHRVAPSDPKLAEKAQGIQKIGDLPGLTDAGKLLDTKEWSQSATDIVTKLAKIQTLKPDELVNEYRNRYSSLLAEGEPVTAETRKEIQEQEYERLINLASEDAKKEIEEIRRPDESINFTRAVDKIVGGSFRSIDDKKTQEVIAGLDLKNTNTLKLHELVKKKADLLFNLEETKAKLEPLNEAMKKHEKSLKDINHVEKDWKKKSEWGYKGPIFKSAAYYATYATVALGLGGLGLGMLGAVGTGFGVLSAPAWMASSFAGLEAGGLMIPGAIGGVLKSMIGTFGYGLPLGVTAAIYSGYEWGYQIYTRPAKFWHSMVAWQKKRDVWEKEEELGIKGKLQDEIDEATETIAKYKNENKEKVTKITAQKQMYEAKRTELTNRINAASPLENVTTLQSDLTKVSEMIASLETILVLLNSAETADSGGFAGLTSENAIVDRIKFMIPDSQRKSKLETVAAKIDKDNRAQQKTLHDMTYRGGLKTEVEELESDTTLESISRFLNQADAKFPEDLEGLKTHSIKLYNTLKALAALPSDNLYRKRTTELLKFVLKEARLEPARKVVLDMFGELKEPLQKLGKKRPRAIYDACEHKDELGTGPKRGQKFADWIKDLDAHQLDLLKDDLQVLNEGYEVQGKDIVDRLKPLQEKINKLFDDLAVEPTTSLHRYLNTSEGREKGMDEIAKLLGEPKTTFELVTAGSTDFKTMIGLTKEKDELTRVRDTLAKVKGVIEYDEASHHVVSLTVLDSEISTMLKGLSDNDKKSRIVGAFMARPEILRNGLPRGLELREPAGDETNSFTKYRKKLPFAQKEILRDVLRKLVPDPDVYVLNAAESGFELAIKSTKDKIMTLYSGIDGAGTSTPLRNFLDTSPAERIKLTGEKLGMTSLTLTTRGSTFEELIRNTTKSEELDQIVKVLEQMKGKIAIDEDGPTPELIKPMDDEVQALMTNIDRRNRPTKNAISTNPKLLLGVRGAVGVLPSPEDSDNYDAYYKKLTYSKKKLLKAVLKIIDEQSFVFDGADRLVLPIVKLRMEVMKSITDLGKKLSAETNTKHEFTLEDYNEGMKVIFGRWAAAHQSTLTGTNFENAVESLEKEEDLRKLHGTIVKISTECYYSEFNGRNKFELKADIDQRIERAWEDPHERRWKSLKLREKIQSNPEILHQRDNFLPEPRGEVNFMTYLRQLTNYNDRERLCELLEIAKETRDPKKFHDSLSDLPEEDRDDEEDSSDSSSESSRPRTGPSTGRPDASPRTTTTTTEIVEEDEEDESEYSVEGLSDALSEVSGESSPAETSRPTEIVTGTDDGSGGEVLIDMDEIFGKPSAAPSETTARLTGESPRAAPISHILTPERALSRETQIALLNSERKRVEYEIIHNEVMSNDILTLLNNSEYMDSLTSEQREVFREISTDCIRTISELENIRTRITREIERLESTP